MSTLKTCSTMTCMSNLGPKGNPSVILIFLLPLWRQRLSTQVFRPLGLQTPTDLQLCQGCPFFVQCCVILGHFGGDLFSVDQDWWSLPNGFGDYSVRIMLRIRDSMQLHSSKVCPRPPAAGSQAGFSMASQMADFLAAEMSPGYFT